MLLPGINDPSKFSDAFLFLKPDDLKIFTTGWYDDNKASDNIWNKKKQQTGSVIVEGIKLILAEHLVKYEFNCKADIAVNQAGWGYDFLNLAGLEIFGSHPARRPKYHTVIL